MSEIIRFTPARKAAIVKEIRAGALTPDEARERYTLSREELDAWIEALSTRGTRGLMTTSRARNKVKLI